VEVVEAFRGGKNPALPFFLYKRDAPALRPLVEALDGMTGQSVSSFTGAHRAEAGEPLRVDEVQNDERFSADFPKPVAAKDLPKLVFHAHHYVPGPRPHEVSRSYGEFTLAGPKADSLQPLPDRVGRITYDPIGMKHYGISDHGVAEIDLAKKKVNKLDPGLDVPEISWPADVTFDTKRERLLLITSGGGGYLYAYYPKTGKWEVLAEKLRLNNLTYHPKDDTLYAVKVERGGEGGLGAELQHINAKGAVVKTTALDGPLVPGTIGDGPGVQGTQLIPADDKLVLLIAPTDRLGSEIPGPKWSYMYLIDLKTGKAQLTWKEKAAGK
jgi:hypothetical protein